MTASPSVQLPDEQRQLLNRSRKLAWLSIGLLTSAAGFMALTLGQSQAMKTAWISDLLSLIPPIALLVAMRFELRSPTLQFPFGYSRAISVSFLATSSVLTLFGFTLFIDAAMKLVAGERPPIGTLVVAGHQIWAGWLMIAALAYSLAGLLMLNGDGDNLEEVSQLLGLAFASGDDRVHGARFNP